MRVLFLSRWFPYPVDNGSKIRIYNLLKGMAQRHEVALLSFIENENLREYIPVLQEFCHKVDVVPWKEYDPKSLRAIAGFVNSKPRSIVDTFSKEMSEKILAATRGKPGFDWIIASEMMMAAYQPYFRQLPALVEDIELAPICDPFVDTGPVVSKISHSFRMLKLKHYLQGLIPRFQACTVVSENEKNLLLKVCPSAKSVHIIPNCIDVSSYSGYATEKRPHTLIYTGSLAFAANYEAVVFFLKDVFPLVRKEIGDVQFYITGKTAGRSIPTELLSENIILTGYVENIKPFIAQSQVSVVPLMSGGGTRLKILEAFALRTPVISTSKGAEGLDVINGCHLLIADTPQEFAACTVQLLRDQELYGRLVRNGYQLVKDKYDWAAVLPDFLKVMVPTSFSTENTGL